MEKTPAEIDQHFKEKHMKSIERAYATDIMIEHSMWLEEPWGERTCSAKGCNHTYLSGMIPTHMDILTHQLWKLEEAGFGFSPAVVPDPRIAKLQALINSSDTHPSEATTDPYFSGHRDGFKVALSVVKNILED